MKYGSQKELELTDPLWLTEINTFCHFKMQCYSGGREASLSIMRTEIEFIEITLGSTANPIFTKIPFHIFGHRI